MQNTAGNSMYALRDLPGKGTGLVALEKIPKGTRILSEEPLITAPRCESDIKRLETLICKQVDALSEPHRHAFLSMHNIYSYSTAATQYLGIMRTVALPITNEASQSGIFLEACLINHACDNNAQKYWNENIKRHTVHALRDIDQGEEITIYYLDVDKNRAARREALKANFNFTCLCGLCSLPLEQSMESDKRLDEIQRLEVLIDQEGLRGMLSSPRRVLRYVDQQINLCNEDRPGSSPAFFSAAQIAIAHGDLARGRIFAEMAVSAWQTSLGDDSPEVREHAIYAQDPSKHHFYGLSKKWTTAVDDVPRGLAPGDFEAWLWTRENPKPSGELADFRNRTNFPGFHGLPH